MADGSVRGTIPRARIAVLGLITIACYGSWFYAFGVLLDPIVADTGWGEATLASAFGVSVLVGGSASVLGGWLLDRIGTRVVFGTAALITLISFQIAAATDSVVVFSIAASIGGGALSALGFYHVTQTAAVRISPDDTRRAIAVLTIWGAFSSAIFIPLAAFLVEASDWRVALRVMTIATVVALVVGAIAVDTKGDSMPKKALVIGEIRDAMRTSVARRFVVSQGLAGIGVSVLLVYQVPAMTSAGLPLAAASFWAGARGFSQLGGRVPLMRMVRRLGIPNTLRIAYAGTALGTVALAFAGTPLVAALYALLAGFGIGATSPLVGMYSSRVFGERGLGTAMGLMTLVFLVIGSLGPPAAGLVAESTGSRFIPVLGAAVVVAGAALVLKDRSRE